MRSRMDLVSRTTTWCPTILLAASLPAASDSASSLADPGGEGSPEASAGAGARGGGGGGAAREAGGVVGWGSSLGRLASPPSGCGAAGAGCPAEIRRARARASDSVEFVLSDSRSPILRLMDVSTFSRGVRVVAVGLGRPGGRADGTDERTDGLTDRRGGRTDRRPARRTGGRDGRHV